MKAEAQALAQLQVLPNSGGGRFGKPQVYAVPGRSLVVGDFNGDRRLDVATLDYVSHVLINRGKGLLAAPRDYAAGGGAYAQASGDFNRDGKADLAVANFGTKDVSILLAGAGGKLAAPLATRTIPGSNDAVTGDL